MVYVTLPNGEKLQAEIKLPEIEPLYPVTVKQVHMHQTFDFEGMLTPESTAIHPDISWLLIKSLYKGQRLPRKKKKAYKKRLLQEWITKTDE